MARAAAVVARVSAAPTRRSAVRAAISPSRRLPASRRPPVRRRRAPTVARPGPAGPARAVTARVGAAGRGGARWVRRAVRLAPPPGVPAARRPAVVPLPPGTAQPVAVPGPVVVRLLEAGRAGPRRAAPVRVLPSARLAQVAEPPVARARAG